MTIDERVDLIKKSVSHLSNVEVDSFQGLTVEYAKKKGADVLLRGLRTSFDFEYELQLSQTNNALYSDLKTVFLITKPEFNFISSSMVREILANKGDISKFVPKAVEEFLISKGGMVEELKLASKIFLAVLCLISGPVMKIFQNCIPWLSKQFNNIGKFIGKTK